MLLAAAARGQYIHADFDSVSSLAAEGWVFKNASVPAGTTGWYQGNLNSFPPQATTGFIETDYLCGSGVAVQNNWMLLPTRPMQNGEVLQFWTRTLFNPAPYPDRLQVRLSQAEDSTNVGTPGVPTSVGDFTTLLLDINPLYSTTAFPGTWTKYTIVLSGLPSSGVTGRLAFRYFVENGGPLGVNGAFIGIDTLDYVRGGVASGACCLPDGSCVIQTSPGCDGIGGTYSGDNTDCQTVQCPVPPSGACCLPDGSCDVLSAASCATSFGVYGGDNTVCATCQPFGFVETVDAGGLPGTAADIAGPGTILMTKIFGHMNASDTDMFRFRICDRAAFTASTLTGTLDTQLFLFDQFGRGITMDDDGPSGEPGSIITGALVPSNGTYLLTLTLYNRDPVDGSSHLLWNDTNPSGGFYPEWAPSGASAGSAVRGWVGGNQVTGDYTVTLTGACFLGAAACYPNCDNSSSPPILNANDFQCYLNKFGGLDPYANCDGSTTTPILSANDFQCFLNSFASGCT